MSVCWYCCFCVPCRALPTVWYHRTSALHHNKTIQINLVHKDYTIFSSGTMHTCHHTLWWYPHTPHCLHGRCFLLLLVRSSRSRFIYPRFFDYGSFCTIGRIPSHRIFSSNHSLPTAPLPASMGLWSFSTMSNSQNSPKSST